MKAITLQYMKQLQEQAKETKYDDNELGMSFDSTQPNVPTSDAKKAQQTLASFKVTITLDEMKSLEEKAKETKFNEYAAIFDDGKNAEEPTTEALEAKAILEKAVVMITLDERKALEEKAKETRFNEYSAIFNDRKNAEEPTNEALKAKAILEKASVMITLDEMKTLEEMAKETRFNEYAAIFDDSKNGEEPTDAALKAKAILEKATVIITLEEMKTLEEMAKETTFNEYEAIFNDGMIETDTANQAKSILSRNNLVIGNNNLVIGRDNLVVGESQQTLFSTQEIGKATLQQQKQTSEKMVEENTRTENQILLDMEERN